MKRVFTSVRHPRPALSVFQSDNVAVDDKKPALAGFFLFEMA